MENINPIDVGKGITDFGFMVITAAFYLACTGAMMFYFIKWFVKIINGIIDRQQKTMDEILDIQRAQFDMIKDIREGVNDELLAQVKVLSGYAFDNAKNVVFRSLEKVKKENHIDNRPAIEKKIRLILENLHSNRNSKFDNFSYAGKRLSEYTRHEWVDKIAEIMLCELYDEAGYNNGRAANNIDLAYEEIKVEFYKNLKK